MIYGSRALKICRIAGASGVKTESSANRHDSVPSLSCQSFHRLMRRRVVLYAPLRVHLTRLESQATHWLPESLVIPAINLKL
jgi:hypothetical protein